MSACVAALVVGLGVSDGFAQTSETSPQLKRALARFPDADADDDGILTLREAREYQHKQRGRRQAASTDSDTGGSARPAYETEIFRPTAAELAAAMDADNAAGQRKALHFEKGNGLRIVSTGHSWVGPALRTLPEIAAAAGLDGQHIRSHTGGGRTGSANAIWRKEFGKYADEPARPILLPAIATGQWDVMTWGAFYGDRPEYFSQWIDVSLKANSKMVFYLQDGWPIFDRGLHKADAAQVLRALDQAHRQAQQTTFREFYDVMQKKYPDKVFILPAGAAVVDMLHRYYAGELPSFDCVSEHLGGTKGIFQDGSHLSRNSGMEWLVGYVYYGTLYRRSPEKIASLVPPNVPPEVDRAMRQAAWNAIINSPYSGVSDANGDGIGDAGIR